MKSATNSYPKKCQCSAATTKPKTAEWSESGLKRPPYGLERGTWYVECIKECGRVYVWSWPNVWRNWHTLELGRTREIVS